MRRLKEQREGAGKIDVTVTRTGDLSGAASVDFASSDGTALQASDYNIAIGTLDFAPAEASKTFTIFITNDGYMEASETFSLALSNPKGGFSVSGTTTSTITITDNDPVPSATNPIDNTAFFVRQHYIDFLNREPEPQGVTDWQNILNNCPQGSTQCDRVQVSSSFYRSPEFGDRGYFVYRFYKVRSAIRSIVYDGLSNSLKDAVLIIKGAMHVSFCKTRIAPSLVSSVLWVIISPSLTLNL